MKASGWPPSAVTLCTRRLGNKLNGITLMPSCRATKVVEALPCKFAFFSIVVSSSGARCGRCLDAAQFPSFLHLPNETKSTIPACFRHTSSVQLLPEQHLARHVDRQTRVLFRYLVCRLLLEKKNHRDLTRAHPRECSNLGCTSAC